MSVLRFGAFELHLNAGELRRRGDVVKLPPQPFKVLEALVRRGGEVVTRDEIREQVWPGDTFVDFEQGLNFCIRQIREALGDNADSPRTSKRSQGGATASSHLSNPRTRTGPRHALA